MLPRIPRERSLSGRATSAPRRNVPLATERTLVLPFPSRFSPVSLSSLVGTPRYATDSRTKEAAEPADKWAWLKFQR